MTSIPPNYQKVQALETYYRLPAGERKDYRDTVIGIYLAAADERYYAFRGQLSGEAKGSRFGLGVAALGLSTGASLAGEQTANTLAALATGAKGIEGTAGREVYFDKTLPALLAGIDAQRIKILGSILKRMGEADSYSLTEALVDVERYAASASLESAIEMVTAEASDRRAVEQARFDREVLFISGVPDEGVTDIRYEVRTKLVAFLDNPAALTRAAQAVEVQPGASARETVIAINRKFAAETDAQKVKDMAAKVTAALEGN